MANVFLKLADKMRTAGVTRADYERAREWFRGVARDVSRVDTGRLLRSDELQTAAAPWARAPEAATECSRSWTSRPRAI